MNEFMVGVQGEDVMILRLHGRLTKKEALNLAAWLVALADMSPEYEEFQKALREACE